MQSLLLASLKNGDRVYGDIQKPKEGETTFQVPKNTEFLWLVVSGAPKEHWPIDFRQGQDKEDEQKEEQWPYTIKLTGTDIKKR